MAMVAMHYDGDCNKEKAQLKEIENTVKENLDVIKTTISEMSYWGDEKSEAFKKDVSELVAKLTTILGESTAAGESTLDRIEQLLSIYSK